jgi:hypothetical protein
MPYTNRIRRYLGLRQQDVSAHTGIPLYRLSGYEVGKLQLNETERRSLLRYLRTRLQAIRHETGSPDLLELLVGE